MSAQRPRPRSLAAAVLLPAASLLLLLCLLAPAGASCYVGYRHSCSYVNFTSTSTVFWTVNRTSVNEGFDTYNATLTFTWGDENVTTGPVSYAIGEQIGISNTHQYEEEGYHPSGTTLVFEDSWAAAGCSGETFETSRIVWMDRAPLRCESDAETPPPTGMPSTSAGPTAADEKGKALAEGAGSGGIGRSGGRTIVAVLGAFLEIAFLQ